MIALRARSIPRKDLQEDQSKRWITLHGGGSGKAINADAIRRSAPEDVIHITEGPTDLISLRELILIGHFKESGKNGKNLPSLNTPLVAIPSVADLDPTLMDLLIGRKVCFWIDAGAEPLRFFEQFKARGSKYNMEALSARQIGLLPGHAKDVNEYLKEVKSL